MYGLAMRNLGSISTQALGGVISTATHGTGIAFKVLPGDVMALTVLLANGELVACSHDERSDLFFATLSGLGCTGLIVTVQLSLEPAFRLREIQETVRFDDVVDNLEVMVARSEHVRLWWYPQSRAVRVSSADRTVKVQVRTYARVLPAIPNRAVRFTPLRCSVPRMSRLPPLSATRPSGALCSPFISSNSSSLFLGGSLR